MSAMLLGERAASRFEVVGAYGASDSVVHVGILANACTLAPRAAVGVFDMGPPLRMALPNPMTPSVVGWLPLTKDEDEQLDTWLADIRTRASACEYIAFPSEQRITDPVSGRVTAWKFSCAGFVQTAYAEGAGVPLVVLEKDLPPIDFATIRLQWQHILGRFSDLEAQRILHSFGISGSGPWRVLLPGYLVRAFAKGRACLPYVPVASDLRYP